MSNLTKEWLNKSENENKNDYIFMAERKRGRLMMLIGSLRDMADWAKEMIDVKHLIKILKQ